MSRYALTRKAADDLNSIQDYLAKSSPRAAVKLIALLESKCEKIAEFPEIGAVADEFATGLRSLSVGNYVIFYRIGTKVVEIVRILHAARNLPPLLADE